MSEDWCLDEKLNLASSVLDCIENNVINWENVSNKMVASNKELKRTAVFYSAKTCCDMHSSLLSSCNIKPRKSKGSRDSFNQLAAEELKQKLSEELKAEVALQISNEVQAYKKLTRELDKIRKGEVASEQLRVMLDEQIRIDNKELNLENVEEMDEEELMLVKLIGQFSQQPITLPETKTKDKETKPAPPSVEKVVPVAEKPVPSKPVEVVEVTEKTDEDIPLATIAQALSPKKEVKTPEPLTRRSLRGTPVKTPASETPAETTKPATVTPPVSPAKKTKTEEKTPASPALKLKINLKGDNPAVEKSPVTTPVIEKTVTRRQSRNLSDDRSETSVTSPTRSSRKSTDAKLDKHATTSRQDSGPLDYVDDISYKTWKNKVLAVLRRVAEHRHANLFAHAVTDRDAPGYTDTVKRPMDLTKIKKNIENGVILSTDDFKRDLLLMFVNAVMYNHSEHDVHKMAVQMAGEALNDVEYYMSPANEELPQVDMAKTRRSGRLHVGDTNE